MIVKITYEPANEKEQKTLELLKLPVDSKVARFENLYTYNTSGEPELQSRFLATLVDALEQKE
jgi:hypothetical protein